MGREKKALLILCPEDSLQYILSDPLSVQEEPWCKAIAFLEFQDDLLKFSFSEKATKMYAICLMVLTFT